MSDPDDIATQIDVPPRQAEQLGEPQAREQSGGNGDAIALWHRFQKTPDLLAIEGPAAAPAGLRPLRGGQPIHGAPRDRAAAHRVAQNQVQGPQ